MLFVIIGSVLGAAVMGTILFLLGQNNQQRKQVLEMRGTNVKLFTDLQETNNAYEYLKQQVQKIQSGPVSAVISFEQVNQIAELVSAKLDFTALRGTEITKKSVN